MPKPTPEQLREREEFLVRRRQMTREADERLGIVTNEEEIDKWDAASRRIWAESDAKMDAEDEGA